MLGALVDGLLQIFQPEPALYLLVGMVAGLVIGFLPGLGGLATIALLLPFLFGMDPIPGLAFILGAYGACSFGGSITAIIANTPGTGEQVVTTFDGYAMTRQGKAARALGVSATASALGGLFGVLVLFAAIPFARSLIVFFRPPEVFALGVLGVLLMGVMDARTVTKGIISGTVGLMLSFVGLDPVTGIGRLTMGTLVLRDGLDLTAITMGLFAVAEMFAVYTRGTSIARGVDVKRSRTPGHRVIDGFFDVVRNWKLTIQCALLGAVTGVIPGIGATAAMFFSYGYAKKRSKTPERFGSGAPEGVLGPEAANNAKEGGSLVPTLSFGIPGSSGMALMIGVFLLLGYVPGPEMMRENLDIVFLIAWVIAISNILASFIGLGMAPLLTKMTFLRAEIVVPVLIIIALVGSYVDARLPWVMWLAVAFGFLGYVTKSLGYSNAGIILGFVLGPVVGRNLNLALQTYGAGFVLRPVTVTVLAFAAAALALPVVRRRLLDRAQRTLGDQPEDDTGRGNGNDVLEEV